MRILQINSTTTGSTGEAALTLHAQFKKDGHDSLILFGRGEKSDDPCLIKFCRSYEVYFHALRSCVTGCCGKGSRPATHRLIRKITDFKPDVVHLHCIHGYYVNVYLLLNFLKKSGIKTVLTMHDEWVFTGKCDHSRECDRWHEECGKCPHLRDYPKSLILDKTKYEARKKGKLFYDFENITFSAVSDTLADKAKESPILAGKQIETVYNAADTSAVCRNYMNIYTEANNSI